MYFVKKYQEGKCFIYAPFDSKDAAIKYFNLSIDQKSGQFIDHMYDFDKIEILNDNCVLFDYEV